MSVEIDWQALTTGPDGAALADSIRDFIHDKFQQVTLPKFIRSVRVHSFEFGDECPSVVLKDVCDPLDEFYEDDDESEEEDEGDEDDIGSDGVTPHPEGNRATVGGAEGNLHASVETIGPSPRVQPQVNAGGPSAQMGRRMDNPHQLNTTALSALDRASAIQNTGAISSAQQRPGGLRTLPSFVDQLASPLLTGRSGTPGIPGGTANLSYFHHAPFSQHQSSFPAPWSDYNFARPEAVDQPHAQRHHQSSSSPPPPPPPPPPLTPLNQQQPLDLAAYSAGDPSTRPSTATTQTPLSRVPTGSQEAPAKATPSKTRKRARGRSDIPLSSPPRLPSPGLSGPSSDRPEPNPQDIQLVLHVKYSGGIRLALSAEILLDYPMSSFVSIPLQLTITGVDFDGVAIVAHVRTPLSSEEAARTAAAMSGTTAIDHDSELDGPDAQQNKGNRGRAHICFLSPEDAQALLGADVQDLTSGGGDEMDDNGTLPSSPFSTPDSPTDAPIRRHARKNEHEMAGGKGYIQEDDGPGGGLLREIRVESEIGQRRDGQQSLRNVGKVERFVLEQVRRIFEDEFVWPSFWTFLL